MSNDQQFASYSVFTDRFWNMWPHTSKSKEKKADTFAIFSKKAASAETVDLLHKIVMQKAITAGSNDWLSKAIERAYVEISEVKITSKGVVDSSPPKDDEADDMLGQIWDIWPRKDEPFAAAKTSYDAAVNFRGEFPKTIVRAVQFYLKFQNSPIATSGCYRLSTFLLSDHLGPWIERLPLEVSARCERWFYKTYRNYPPYETKEADKEDMLHVYNRCVKPHEYIRFFCAVRAYKSAKLEEVAGYDNDGEFFQGEVKFVKKFTNFIEVWREWSIKDEAKRWWGVLMLQPMVWLLNLRMPPYTRPEVHPHRQVYAQNTDDRATVVATLHKIRQDVYDHHTAWNARRNDRKPWDEFEDGPKQMLDAIAVPEPLTEYIETIADEVILQAECRLEVAPVDSYHAARVHRFASLKRYDDMEEAMDAAFDRTCYDYIIPPRDHYTYECERKVKHYLTVPGAEGASHIYLTKTCKCFERTPTLVARTPANQGSNVSNDVLLSYDEYDSIGPSGEYTLPADADEAQVAIRVARAAARKPY